MKQFNGSASTGFKTWKRLSIAGLRLCLAGMVASAACSAMAQRGDRKGEEQPEVWKNFDVPSAPALSPEEAIKSFRIAPGYRIELVAAEPLVVDPVAMKWDADGRIWVVEMRGFMPNVDGEGEQEPIGRVVVLEDTDGDGRMDESTVFLEDLVMPRAVGLVEGGVLIAEPPNLWYCRDTNGDLECDEKTSVYGEYGQQGPVEHTDNGLVHNLDNWIYNAKSALRFKFQDGKLVAKEENKFRGQWGIAHDDDGRLYSNSNSSYLHADFVPAHYLRRNRYFESDYGLTENIVDSQEVFTIRVNTGINRGYQGHMLREDGRLARTTAISGQTIYRGDRYPEEVAGNAFVPEPAGNVVVQFKVHEEGIRLGTDHVTYEDPDWGKREFLASTDERFRPVNAYTGPDGCLYILDMYRGILQHKVYVTTFLRKQILERDLDQPVGLGRIYRIVHESSDPGMTRAGLSEASSEALVEHLAHPNGWWRDTAQRLLVQRRDRSVIGNLREMAKSHANHLARVHALWTLHGINGLDHLTVLDAMRDEHPKVLIAAMRTGETLLEGEDMYDYVDRLAKMIDTSDQAVRVQVMYSLGEATPNPQAEVAMADLLTQQAGDRFIRDAALSGLGGREAAMLQRVLDRQTWAEEKGGYEATLRQLAELIRKRGDPDQMTMVLSMAASQPENLAWRQSALLKGLGEGKNTVEFQEKPGALSLLESSENPAVQENLKPVLEALTWSGDTRERKSSANPLTPEEQELYELGKITYQATCMACHQPNGKGLAGLAPPLVDSPWVLGSPERLVRIALDGLTGPVEVKGEMWNLEMPGHRASPFLTDERFAGILTYIRRSWGHEASAIHPDTVGRIRDKTEERGAAWTVEELKKIE